MEPWIDDKRYKTHKSGSASCAGLCRVVAGCAGLCRVVPGCAGCAGCAGCGEAYAHTYALRMVLVATYADKTHMKRTQNAQETYAFVHLNSLKSVYFEMFSIPKTSSKDWMGLNTFEPILFRACQEKG